jgi:HNH endonuclease
MKRVIWTQEEIEFLKNNYENTLTSQLAQILGKNISAVYRMAYSLQIRKTQEFIKSFGSTLSQHPAALANRIKTGNEPYNKGKKMPDHIRNKVLKTFFKAGHLPHNTKSDGALSKRSDGYWWMRVGLANWKQVHRVVWEQANGPLQKNDVIRFKDGNRDNYQLDNLELTTKQGNMQLNTIHRYPDEVKQTIRSITKLNKFIKKNEK